MKQCDTKDWGSWHLHEGQEGTLTEDLPTLCCDHVIPAGADAWGFAYGAGGAEPGHAKHTLLSLTL